jgi:hypothetical protein
MKKTAFLFFLIYSTTLFAQKNKAKKDAGVDYLFTKEMYGGFRIQSNGFSVYLEHGWIKNIYRTHIVQVEYQYFFDPKEIKTPALREGGKSYVFGLQNRFHALRASYGFEQMIADKADRNGVKLSFVGFAGVSLGLLKPYYVEVVDFANSYEIITHSETYNGSSDSRVLSKDSIFEASPYSVGMDKMKPILGGHIKLGLNFDWGKRDAFVKAIELGVMMDVYYKKVPIMINNSTNRMIHPAFYIGFHLGKRW